MRASKTPIRRGRRTRPPDLAFALAAVALVVAGRPAHASPAPADTIEIRSTLGIGRVSQGRRTPVVTDPIESMIARGVPFEPAEGDTMLGADGSTLVWARYEADHEGYVQDDGLAGGYAFAEVEARTGGIYLLDAAGHRHVYVNGVPRIGDVYHRGFLRIPVRLDPGRNTLLFRHGWGAVRARLVRPPADACFDERDDTVASIVAGDAAPHGDAGLVVTNASDEWRHDLEVRARSVSSGDVRTSPAGPLPPLSCRKVAVRIPIPASLRTPSARASAIAGDSLAVPDSLRYTVELIDGNRVLDTRTLTLDVVAPTEKHYRSFVSAIDGSVQHYGVTPPPAVPDSSVGLVLTLHGAGVPARQAHHYAPRDDAYIVAPTNRREFGFDWEDWGRLDALEVLGEAERHFDVHPRRRWLTGHSMGGHGTWNLGSHFPDRFGAIAPSAGWPDFWSYGGADSSLSVDVPLEEILHRSANASRTDLFETNLRHGGVYVLHGDEDRTVPVTLARAMRERLARFHTNWAYYEKEGAGHWWGPNSACMDWPPLMDFLVRNPLPEPAAVREVSFTTVSPSVSARCFWATIESQARSMHPSAMEGQVVPESLLVRLATDNVTRLSIDLTAFADTLRARAGGRTLALHVDGQKLLADPGAPRVRVSRSGDRWRLAEAADPRAKRPERCGPFKAAFQNGMIFVVATGGDEDERALVLRRALYDAESFYYRGNGSVPVLLDTDFDPAAYPGRNVVLYGNADTHRDWAALVGEDCPIAPRRGAVAVGDTTLTGDDLACLLVFPRTGDETASVGVVAGSGATGIRASMQFPVFTSGVGYPDWVVIGADALEEGATAVRAAGFFDERWELGEDLAFR